MSGFTQDMWPLERALKNDEIEKLNQAIAARDARIAELEAKLNGAQMKIWGLEVKAGEREPAIVKGRGGRNA